MLIQQTTTAIEAFHGRHSKSAQQRQRVLDFITERGGDWSIGELAWAMGLEKSTISARVNELLYESKELEERPKRKDLRSGITIRPVALPATQLSLFQ